MGMYDFIKLDSETKMDLAWEHGDLIASTKLIEDGIQKSFLLLRLNDFYVEIESHRTKECSCVLIDAIPFKKGRRLNKYLANISLEALGV
jgi:hypothetical protein